MNIYSLKNPRTNKIYKFINWSTHSTL